MNEIKDRDVLNMDKQPFNPLIYKSIKEILEDQLLNLPEYPEGTEFGCERCGDCCQFFYMHFKMPQDLLDEIGKRAKHPHGYWVLKERKHVRRGKSPMQFFMPVFSAHHQPMMDWTGNIPKDRSDFLEFTGRRHGYWVFNGVDIVLYCPAPCNYLIVDGHGKNACDVYSGRPEICEKYYCKRHPVEEES